MKSLRLPGWLRRLGWPLLSLLLAACLAGSPPASPTGRPAATLPGGAQLTASPAASVVPPPAATPASAGQALRVWLPPEFAPNPGAAPGSQVLAAQLAQFEQTHANVTVEMRLKAATGQGGLLHSLLAAYNVAPAVLPNVIALSRDDLAAAAAAGLVIPLDKFFSPEVMGDYYPFAQALSRGAGDKLVGLPFAAEARVLVYNASFYAGSPLTWTTVTTGTFIFPGAEASGLTLLTEYLALGGSLTDNAGQLALEAETLAQALAFFRSARDAGLLPMSSLAYADAAATWQAFGEGRATLAVTSAQLYLAGQERQPSIAATLLPAPGGKPLALAEGWSWAMVNTRPEQQAEAVTLLTWLTDSEQLSAWTQAAGVLPTRVSVLAGWQPSPSATFARLVLAQAQLQPARSALSVLGPPLQQALSDTLNDRATPLSAAATAAQTVNKP